jgi:hypothetical protein
MALFVLIGVLSPRRRLYEPEDAGSGCGIQTYAFLSR